MWHTLLAWWGGPDTGLPRDRACCVRSATEGLPTSMPTQKHTNSETPEISCQNNTPPCHQGINRLQGHVKSWTVKIISMHLGHSRAFLNTLRPMDGRKRGRKRRDERIERSEEYEGGLSFFLLILANWKISQHLQVVCVCKSVTGCGA